MGVRPDVEQPVFLQKNGFHYVDLFYLKTDGDVYNGGGHFVILAAA